MEFSWHREDPYLYKTTISQETFTKVMNSGMLHGNTIGKVVIISGEDYQVFYDFEAAKRGQPPFVME